MVNVISTHKSRDVTRKIFDQCFSDSRGVLQSGGQGGILIYRTVGPRMFKQTLLD
jgi:hypothetical protein